MEPRPDAKFEQRAMSPSQMEDSPLVLETPRAGWRRFLLPASLIVVLGLRLLLLIPAVKAPDRSLLADSQGYLDLAESLRTKGTFEADAYTESLRTPGYPVFLAAVQSVFGGVVVPAIVVQVFLSVAVAGVVFLVGARAVSPSVGWAAAFLWALNPNSIFWPFTILSETLFAFLIAVCCLLEVLALRRNSLAWHAVSGLVLGMAVLVRPIGIYLIPVWILVLAVHGVRLYGWRRGAWAAAALGLAAYSLAFAWSARNLLVHQEFYLSKTQGVTLRNYVLARALADARGLSRSEASQMISDTSDLGELTRQIFEESPWSIPRVIAGGIVRTALGTEAETWLSLFGLPGTSRGLLTSLLAGDLTQVKDALAGLFASPESALYSLLVIWGGGYALAVWLAAGVGWLRNHARLDAPGATTHWLAALSTLYLVAVPLANGDARFRMPVDPLLAFLAAVTFLGRRRFGEGRTQREDYVPRPPLAVPARPPLEEGRGNEAT